jgi:membrane protease YdiL (CAAX protease family)
MSVLRDGVTAWRALNSIEVSSASMFVGLTCMVGLGTELLALMRAQDQDFLVDQGVYMTHILASSAPTVAALACVLVLSDSLPSPLAILPEKQSMFESIVGAAVAGALGFAITMLSSFVLCTVYGEAEWMFDAAQAQFIGVFAVISMPLEEIGYRNYLYLRLKQVFTPAATSVIVGLLTALLSVPQYWYLTPFACATPCHWQLTYHVLGHVALSLLAGMVHDSHGGAVVPVIAFRVAHVAALAGLGLAQIGSFMLAFSQVGIFAFVVLRLTLFAPPPESPLDARAADADSSKDD